MGAIDAVAMSAGPTADGAAVAFGVPVGLPPLVGVGVASGGSVGLPWDGVGSFVGGGVTHGSTKPDGSGVG